MSAIFANDLPYAIDGQNDSLQALKDTLAFAVDDWGESRAMSWVYGIVLGWDDDEDEGSEAMAEQAARHGWTPGQVARLRALHQQFEALAAPT